MTLTLQTLAHDDEEGFDRAFAIYRDAIELTEQRTRAELRGLQARPDYRFLVAIRDGAMIGMAASWIPKAWDFWLFEYAAVAPARRGGGVGAALFCASVAEAGEGRIGLVEVDSASGGGDAALKKRRLAFYARQGCRRVEGLDYILPLEAHGTPPPMVLLAHAPEAVRIVTRASVEVWLQRIYLGAYGKPVDDPRIARMVAGLPAQVFLAPIE
ncbi:MAG: GNAT family N-acetyltransferase [Alphaproteobacteria bacterium]|nr:GNAT family N-acetyltransferase [Alphaproteobacteria bacterium]